MAKIVVEGVPCLVIKYVEYQLDPMFIGRERGQLSPVPLHAPEACDLCGDEADYIYNTNGTRSCMVCIERREGRGMFTKVYAKV